MARTLLVEHEGFRIGERVELTQQGEQQVAGVRSKTGTVMGFGNHFGSQGRTIASARHPSPESLPVWQWLNQVG